MTALRFAGFILVGALAAQAQDLRDYERKVTEFTLTNGLHFIVLERHQVPVVSFHTYVAAGSAQDPAGLTGLAHLMEHVAFKGTETIGTRNWAEEKKAIDQMDVLYARFDSERNQGLRADAGRMGQIEVNLNMLGNAVINLGDPGEYLRAFQENGAVGIASHTTADASETDYSLPSNRIELWFLMESQRLAHPVFRDAPREVEAIAREYKETVESNAQGMLLQALLATAFESHSYRNPGLGWPGDLGYVRPVDLRHFFETYYVPSNMAIGIVGDVDPDNVRRLAERYFAAVPAGPAPRVATSTEPTQLGPKSVVLTGNARPLLMVGYKRPPESNRDDVIFDVVRSLLADGQLGLAYKNLVEEKKLAQSVDVTATYPGGRSSNLFVFTIVPAQDHSVVENQKALDELLRRLAGNPVDAPSLARVKSTLRTRLMRTLGGNQTLATMLPNFYFNFGDWRKLFAVAGDIERVTAGDVQRVVGQYFTPMNQTVATIVNPADSMAAGGVR